MESSNARLSQPESNHVVETAEGAAASQLPEQHSKDRSGLEIAGEYDLLRWSESLSAIARTGLGFTESLYERERFEEILHIAADIRVTADEQRERYKLNIQYGDDQHPISGSEVAAGTDTAAASGSGVVAGSGTVLQCPADRDGRVNGLVSEWMRQVGKGVPGYVTPKVAVGAVVGNDQGQLLLIQRADSGVWLYPTGWADVGYSAAEVVVKEVKEETGIDVEPIRIIAVLDGFRLGATRIPLYSLVFQCTPLGGTLSPHPLECMDVGWFSEDSLPTPLAAADRWKEHVFRAIHGEKVDVLYDVVRKPVWKGATGGN
ncbi:MAG: NUDIX hydrolase N-terminal domain-containing protein [Actinobacteria bacterium]|nr:NUDIX hydrolase N-terminal domain-containing protein [Actinomycetota bacterium]